MKLLLREFVSDSDLREAVELCCPHPNLLPITSSIKYQLEGRFPEASMRVFANFGQPRCWFGYKRNDFESKFIILLEAVPGIEFHKDEVYGLLTSFAQMTRALDHRTVAIGSSIHEIDAALREYYDVMKLSVSITDYPSRLFYMTNEQMEDVQTVKVLLPEGYHFDSLDPTLDLELILNDWEFAGDQPEEFTRARLRNLPSVCARTKAGDTAAFILADHYGPIAHHFTFEEHRCCGLGKAVELQIAKKFIEIGMTPFKYIMTYNTSVIKAAIRSPFWTQLTSGGCDAIVTWHELEFLDSPDLISE